MFNGLEIDVSWSRRSITCPVCRSKFDLCWFWGSTLWPYRTRNHAALILDGSALTESLPRCLSTLHRLYH